MLYKYLSRQFAEALVDGGEVLFRSLSYFRSVEHAARGDIIEGMHIDAPDHDSTLDTNTLIRIEGRHRVLNSIEYDRVFAFCCSREFTRSLFEEFETDACVAILDPELFFLRCGREAQKHLLLDRHGLIHREVAYFDPAREAPLNPTDPLNIPFMKHKGFAGQREYRGVFARRGGFTLTRRIVKPAFRFWGELQAAKPSHWLLRLGSLKRLTELRSVSDAPDAD